jgi:hypothetical protein
VGRLTKPTSLIAVQSPAVPSNGSLPLVLQLR